MTELMAELSLSNGSCLRRWLESFYPNGFVSGIRLALSNTDGGHRAEFKNESFGVCFAWSN